MPPLPRRTLLLGLLASCGQEYPAPPAEAIELLARYPDATFEQPAEIVPRGDLPETLTFGALEGPGWSQAQHLTVDGRPYKETNQPRATLTLPATRPCERELQLDLWCSRPAGAEPGPVDVRLNGVALVPGGLRPGREPTRVLVRAPAPAWGLGENQLELLAPQQQGTGAWDTLALARVAYGPEIRVELDSQAGTARLPDGAGLRYAIALGGPAELLLAGRADAPGELCLRFGTQDQQSGLRSTRDARSLDLGRGELVTRLPLTDSPGIALLELDWSSPAGAALGLERLAVLEPGARPRPPIVFVSIDTFAARHLSLYGYGRRTSPALEELARDAVVFENCSANAPWTMPSYLSVMTGLYPRAHHVPLASQAGAELANQDWWQVADNRWTLAEALRARGYRTAAFVDTYWLSTQFGVGQGFDRYDGQAALRSLDDPRGGIAFEVEEQVAPWLAARPTAVPFFLFLHALDAHGPYWPEAPYRDAFAGELPEERRPTRAGSTNLTYGTVPTWMARTLVPDEALAVPAELPLEEIIARYDEALLKVDAYLGKLVALLRQHGLYERCVLVVSADHGESFGPQAFGHGVMRGEVLHVPLVLKLPGNAHGGRRVPAAVSLVDLYPTLLELSGAPVGSHLHGRSLLSWLDSPERAGARPIFSEGGHVEQYSLVHEGWKLVQLFPASESGDASLLTHPLVPEEWLRANFPELLTQPLSDELRDELSVRPGYAQKLADLRALLGGPYHELYDLRADPLERRDLARERADQVQRLLPLLEREKQRSRLAARDANPDLVRHGLDPQALQELDDLGY
jgi:arylsulfatase